MKSLVFLTADYANLSQEGKLNIMGVFNRIWAKKYPARHSSFHIVIKLSLELGEDTTKEHELSVMVKDEDAKFEMPLVPPQQFSFPEKTLPGMLPEHTAIFGVKDMVFPKPGIYSFILLVDGESKDTLNLELYQPNSESKG